MSVHFQQHQGSNRRRNYRTPCAGAGIVDQSTLWYGSLALLVRIDLRFGADPSALTLLQTHK
jgi:hypothetical protein